MRRWVVDTNVPIVANGRVGPNDRLPHSIECREAAVRFLLDVLGSGKILVDLEGAIQAEYRTYLNPRGQPGVGDRFYQAVLNSAPHHLERVSLPRRHDGEYADLPQTVIDVGFDRSDRKFAALAKKEDATVANATDSDWLNHLDTLQAAGIVVHFVCGCDKNGWFVGVDGGLNPCKSGDQAI
jgi:hypothetical protein